MPDLPLCFRDSVSSSCIASPSVGTEPALRISAGRNSPQVHQQPFPNCARGKSHDSDVRCQRLCIQANGTQVGPVASADVLRPAACACGGAQALGSLDPLCPGARWR
jgi:hypothetical protein